MISLLIETGDACMHQRTGLSLTQYNGVAPDRQQAITWTINDVLWMQTSMKIKIKSQIISVKKCTKTSAAKRLSRTQCVTSTGIDADASKGKTSLGYFNRNLV